MIIIIIFSFFVGKFLGRGWGREKKKKGRKEKKRKGSVRFQHRFVPQRRLEGIREYEGDFFFFFDRFLFLYFLYIFYIYFSFCGFHIHLNFVPHPVKRRCCTGRRSWRESIRLERMRRRTTRRVRWKRTGNLFFLLI